MQYVGLDLILDQKKVTLKDVIGTAYKILLHFKKIYLF